jgi:hypothetical protein
MVAIAAGLLIADALGLAWQTIAERGSGTAALDAAAVAFAAALEVWTEQANASDWRAARDNLEKVRAAARKRQRVAVLPQFVRSLLGG